MPCIVGQTPRNGVQFIAQRCVPGVCIPLVRILLLRCALEATLPGSRTEMTANGRRSLSWARYGNALGLTALCRLDNRETEGACFALPKRMIEKMIGTGTMHGAVSRRVQGWTVRTATLTARQKGHRHARTCQQHRTKFASKNPCC